MCRFSYCLCHRGSSALSCHVPSNAPSVCTAVISFPAFLPRRSSVVVMLYPGGYSPCVPPRTSFLAKSKQAALQLEALGKRRVFLLTARTAAPLSIAASGGGAAAAVTKQDIQLQLQSGWDAKLLTSQLVIPWFYHYLWLFCRSR